MKNLLILLTGLIIATRSYSQTQIWGMTSTGGKNETGVIFSIDTTCSNYTIQHDFPQTDGKDPACLTRATNGKLYGFTRDGGKYNKGIIFECLPSDTTYIKILDLIDSMGTSPTSAIQASDGMIYATLSSGGIFGHGVLIQYNPQTNSFTKKVEFNGAQGKQPVKIIEAPGGTLYGVASFGGVKNQGVLFSYTLATSTLTNLYDFGMTGVSEGWEPTSIVLAGNGMIYGITYSGGGTNSDGVIFQYNPATSAYIKKFEFQYLSTGSHPRGGFIQASDGMLYGAASGSGPNGSGVAFKFDPASNTYTNIYDFGNSPMGKTPQGISLQASDGMLYGVCSLGGNNNGGTVFKYDITNSTLTSTYDFAPSVGYNPTNSIIEFTPGKLAGVAIVGTSGGSLFHYTLATASVTKQLDVFIKSEKLPQGSLMQASDGKLYGLATGGKYDNGVLFQFNPMTSTYIKKLELQTMNGVYPEGNTLTEAVDGKLYGTMPAGGTNGGGTIIQYDFNTNILTKKFDFNGATSGQTSFCKLTLGNDSMLYGLASSGGTNNSGTLFQYNPITSTFTKKHDFISSSGSTPRGSLLLASDGNFYGLTSSGGANGSGVIFKFDPTTSTFTKVFDLVLSNGSKPLGSLVQASDGMLYGLTSKGGSSSKGVLFQFDPTTLVYTKKVDFSVSNGAEPWGSLIQASDGMLYGMTKLGGTNLLGTLFRYNPSTSILTKKIDFSIPMGFDPWYTNLLEISSVGFGIDELNSSPFLNIYPNPASSQVVVTLTKPLQNFEIKVINIHGQILIQEKASGSLVDLNVSPLSEGIYFLEINDGQSRYTSKLVKLN